MELTFDDLIFTSGGEGDYFIEPASDGQLAELARLAELNRRYGAWEGPAVMLAQRAERTACKRSTNAIR